VVVSFGWQHSGSVGIEVWIKNIEVHCGLKIPIQR
jgi:hypothetical protein